MKYKFIYFLISAVFLIPGIFSLLFWGVKPGIDFTGGSLLEIKVETDNISLKEANVQKSGPNQFIIRGAAMDNQQKEELLAKLKQDLGKEVTELRFETVGPILGKELLQKTLTAVLLVSLIITLYVAKQFKQLKYGVCAILAMFHDSLILLGAFSLLGHFYGIEVNVLFVTALLTTLSFSVHDTIVVFDRIRELTRKNFKLKEEVVVWRAVRETLPRSINNSLTIIIMLLALVILGGESIRWFALALLIGAVTGTYSSTFTAAPLLLLWSDISKLLKKRR